MTREELTDAIIERSNAEYIKFIHCVEAAYSSTVEHEGHYDEGIFSIAFIEALRKSGVNPSIAATMVYFARKHIESIQDKEAGNG